MKKHILLIDDDIEELEILKHALSKLPGAFSCTWAQSAEHALQMLQYLHPDFILLDLNMHNMDGLTCLKEIKNIEGKKSIPVALYSGSITEHVVQAALKNGAVMCLKKSRDTEPLMALLKYI